MRRTFVGFDGARSGEQATVPRRLRRRRDRPAAPNPTLPRGSHLRRRSKKAEADGRNSTLCASEIYKHRTNRTQVFARPESRAIARASVRPVGKIRENGECSRTLESYKPKTRGRERDRRPNVNNMYREYVSKRRRA